MSILWGICFGFVSNNRIEIVVLKDLLRDGFFACQDAVVSVVLVNGKCLFLMYWGCGW